MTKQNLGVATWVFLCCLTLVPGGIVFSQTSTHKYFEEANSTLFLDLYSADQPNAPTMIFIHGGGFVGGSKKAKPYIPFFDALTQNGINVVSIDYSKPLIGQKFHCDQSAENKLMAFGYAARDIRRATNWLLANGTSLGLDTNNIWLCGSSAGAEALLFTLFGYEQPSGDQLPTNFQYSGFISIAGACVDLDLITTKNAIPGMFVHGSCDPLVPVASAFHHYCPESYPGALLLHGPESIADRYDELNKAYYYVLYCGVNHSIANHSLELDIERMTHFIHNKGVVPEMREIIGSSSGCQFPGTESCGDN